MTGKSAHEFHLSPGKGQEVDPRPTKASRSPDRVCNGPIDRDLPPNVQRDLPGCFADRYLIDICRIYTNVIWPPLCLVLKHHRSYIYILHGKAKCYQIYIIFLFFIIIVFFMLQTLNWCNFYVSGPICKKFDVSESLVFIFSRSDVDLPEGSAKVPRIPSHRVDHNPQNPSKNHQNSMFLLQTSNRCNFFVSERFCMIFYVLERSIVQLSRT